MDEYNKAIEELLNDFENLQLIKLVKKVNMQSGTPTESVRSKNQTTLKLEKHLIPLEMSETTKTNMRIAFVTNKNFL